MDEVGLAIIGIIVTIGGFFLGKKYQQEKHDEQIAYAKKKHDEQVKQFKEKFENYNQEITDAISKLDQRKLFSLDEVHTLTHVLARKLKEKNGEGWKPAVIIAISPGGCMIAEFLARSLLGSYTDRIPILTIPMEATESADTFPAVVSLDPRLGYTNGEHFVGLLEQFTNQDSAGKTRSPKNESVLLVNDILHTGRTMELATEFLDEYFKKGVEIIHAAVIVQKTANPPKMKVEVIRALTTPESVSFVYKSDPRS